MKQLMALGTALVALAFAGAAQAQDRGARGKDDIPASARPPAGMCRIWLDDVPVAQQPAPTECATAVRNRPAKGRGIFGDDYVAPKRDSSKDKPAINGFVPKSKEKKPPIHFP